METQVVAPINAQIREHLRLKGIMLAWLAREINVSHTLLSFWVHGKRIIPAARIGQINKALGTDFKEQ